MLPFLHRGRPRSTDEDRALDEAIAGVQLGLDEKRGRWLLFLQDKLAAHRAAAARQAADDPAHSAADGDSPSEARDAG
jgi:hypothetical protein